MKQQKENGEPGLRANVRNEIANITVGDESGLL